MEILQTHPNKYKNNPKADNKQSNQINHKMMIFQNIRYIR